MKTILKVMTMFAFVVYANTLFASGNLKVNIVPVSSEKAVVTITSLQDSNLKISVTDHKGMVVYYREATNSGNNYRKVYDFSDLEDGLYNLSVVNDNLTSERSFQKKQGKINVGEEKTTLEPFFGYKDGILKCTYLNFSKENLTLYFYNENQLIYTKSIGNNFNVVEALNLSKLNKGNYVAILTTGNKEYSYNINID
jgi:hypothetical protein